jgi:transcriptional regulator with XRE-family HTH domain
MASVLVALGKRIRALRKAKGFSQDVLAEKAHIHPTFVSQIERAVAAPTVITLVKIASALGVSPADLLPNKKPLDRLTMKEKTILSISGLLRGRSMRTVRLARSVIEELTKALS